MIQEFFDHFDVLRGVVIQANQVLTGWQQVAFACADLLQLPFVAQAAHGVVDLLLDVAQSGENVVEREGRSIRHPARFVLVGSGNPEEGELRPQLLDRFGLSVEVRSPQNIDERIEVIRRRAAYERDTAAFMATWQAEDALIRDRILAARRALRDVEARDDVLRDCATLCIAIGADGLRGELTLLRAARALAAYEGDAAVTREHLHQVAPLALSHRLRRDPLDEAGSAARIARAMTEVWG